MKWLGCVHSYVSFIVGIGVCGSGNIGDIVRASGLNGELFWLYPLLLLKCPRMLLVGVLN